MPQTFDKPIDDLKALDSCVKFLENTGGIIDLGNKFYRITDTWVLGAKFIDEQSCYYPYPNTLPNFNLAQYLAALKKKPIKIISQGFGGIYGDFESTVPKAIIYYNLYGDTRA